MNSVCRGSIVRNLELGDLLLAGITGGIWGQMSSAAFCVDMLFAGLFHVQVVKAINDIIRINLWEPQQCLEPTC